MDDFVLTNLYESRNEWCCRLLNIFTPLVVEGIQSIFTESWKLCNDNGEINKYLMTFQNLLCRIPKWNAVIIEEERERIIQRSGCNYLEDLITCVHIIQLKVLTSIRVGNKQKKIDITIPKIDIFIHKIYITAARKIYSNVYLFEKSISPLETQKNNRELERIIQESILKTIQESIPTSEIIRAYLDSSVEVEEEVIIEDLSTPDLIKKQMASPKLVKIPEEEKPPEIVPSITNINDEPITTKLTFNEFDSILDENNEVHDIKVSKSINDLERISMEKYLKNKENEDDDDNGRLKIFENDDSNQLVLNDIESLDGEIAANSVSIQEPPLFDFEELT